MTREPQLLRDFLVTHPEAWPVRMALIEELVRDGKQEEARLVIRESPPGSVMPGDYQRRIHIALTEGAEGVNSLPLLLGFEERPATKPKTAPSNPKPRADVPQSTGPTVDKQTTTVTEPETGKLGEPKKAALESLSPGSRALAESAPPPGRGKLPLPARAKASDNPVSSAAPIMRVASAGQKIGSAGDGASPRPVGHLQVARGRFSEYATDLSRTAIVFVVTVLLTGTILICRAPATARNPWKTINGDLVAATAVEFDPKTKIVTLENREKVRTAYQTADLDFASQQRLFFSSAFQKTQLLDAVETWSPEKVKCYTFLGLYSILLIISCMWLTGFLVARRRNPFVAAVASGACWLTGSILMVTYFFIAEHTASAGVMWFGTVVSLGVVALLVSALYQISFFRGLLIFISHAALVGIVIYFLVFHADTVFPSSMRQLWYQAVFVPSGLVES